MHHCTDVRFARFLSGGFTTMAVINPPERKLAKRTSVHWMTLWLTDEHFCHLSKCRWNHESIHAILLLGHVIYFKNHDNLDRNCTNEYIKLILHASNQRNLSLWIDLSDQRKYNKVAPHTNKFCGFFAHTKLSVLCTYFYTNYLAIVL